MAKIVGNQLSLITDFDCEDSPVGDYHFDELGSEEFSIGANMVRLGSKDLNVSGIGYGELGSEKILDPNPISQHLPLGWLEQKPIKHHLYWYWRYYKIDGVRASIYLGKDYTKAIQKVLEIGYPLNAKPVQIATAATDPEKIGSQTENPLYRFPVAECNDYAA
jgi:hypothetical protein